MRLLVAMRRRALALSLTLLALCGALAMPGAACAADASGNSPLLEGSAAPADVATLPPGVRKLADLPYGAAARQRIDVYLPPPGLARTGGAPILVMVHGGAWMFGDKASRGVVGAKIDHWVTQGWILVSVNNRLFPEVEPLEQARDVARAIAFVQRQAGAWDGDRTRLVLMGHSAGAHLVALLSASPALAASSGASRWAGTVVLDSAAVDLEAHMQRRHQRFYDRVFGADPARWHDESPTARLAAGAIPMLLVCSSTRPDDSCGQSERFSVHVNAVGTAARVHREALSHAAINADLGRHSAYTDAVDTFVAEVLQTAR